MVESDEIKQEQPENVSKEYEVDKNGVLTDESFDKFKLAIRKKNFGDSLKSLLPENIYCNIWQLRELELVVCSGLDVLNFIRKNLKKRYVPTSKVS